MILYGDPKVGKSYAALQLALALTGESDPDWLGFPTGQTGPVAYVQLDTPRSLWAERLEELKRAGHPIESDLLFLADRETLQTWPFDILNPDHAQLLNQALAPVKPVAVIVDTLKESNSADENSNTEMTSAINALIAVTQPAALILVAHAKKPNFEVGPDTINDNRGAGATVAKMDAICRMSKKGLYYTGRAIEEGVVKLERGDDGFWTPPSDGALETVVNDILHDPTLSSLREKARALATRLGMGEEQARSLLRRRAQQEPPEPA